MSSRARQRVSFRSMEWLRRAGLAYRLRALLLLISFAIGSLLARDALLIHEAIVVQAALSEIESMDGDDEPAFEERDEPVKIRPSGISRRTAMNPWDPPDDDDELDEDSDTVAAGFVTLAVLPAMDSGEIAEPCLTSFVVLEIGIEGEQRELVTCGISSRGPPARALHGLTG